MDKKLNNKNTPFDNMDDNDIRVLGTSPRGSTQESISSLGKKTKRKQLCWSLGFLCVFLIAIILVCVHFKSKKSTGTSPNIPSSQAVVTPKKKGKGYVTIADTTINEIPLRIYTPHNATPELQIGNIDVDNTPYILGAMAADIGKDHKEWKVVSGFIYKGQLISHSISRWGYCAIIKGKVTIGRELHTPLFEQCIDEGGDFFRHDALVSNGKNVSALRKGRAVRRALVMKGTELCIIETETIVSLHDFAEALCTLKANEAIGLMGSGNAVRWATDKMGRRYATGNTDAIFPNCVNYIVWRSNDK